MPRNGSGGYTLPSAPFVPSTVADAVAVNSNFSDMATALAGSVAADGQTPWTGDMQANTRRITGLGNGTARQDALTVGQLQDGGTIWAGTTGGTASAMTATLAPAITAYSNVMRITLRAGTVCAAGATLNLNGLGAKKLFVVGYGQPVAVAEGDISTANIYDLAYVSTLDSLNGGWVIIGSTIAGRTSALGLAAQTIPSGIVTDIAWTSVATNTLGAWSAGAPTRLTVPAGVSVVALQVGMQWNIAGTTGVMSMGLLENGAVGRVGDDRPANGLTRGCLSFFGAVVAGDYYVLQVSQSTGGPLNISGNMAMTALR